MTIVDLPGACDPRDPTFRDRFFIRL